jgi:hypothetical protein
MDLTDVYRIVHPAAAQYTFFLAALGHKANHQQIQENRNNPLHSISSQCNKTRAQQQKQQRKIYRQLEAEKLIGQQSVGHRRNKRGNKKVSWNIMKMKTTYLKIWDTAKAVLRGKFTAMNAYVKRTEISQINNLMLLHKLLEMQGQAGPKTSRRR